MTVFVLLFTRGNAKRCSRNVGLQFSSRKRCRSMHLKAKTSSSNKNWFQSISKAYFDKMFDFQFGGHKKRLKFSVSCVMTDCVFV